jgi:hypothetical protein
VGPRTPTKDAQPVPVNPRSTVVLAFMLLIDTVELAQVELADADNW